jgi:hypothetical protein
MTPRSWLPHPLADAPFAVRDALELGVRPTRLRSADTERPFWGVRAPVGTSGTLDGLCRSYAARMSQRAFFSHSTAARLHGLPLPSRLSGALPLHVAVPHPSRAPNGRGVVGHRLQIESRDVTAIGGIRLTSLERTVLDLAATLSDEEFLAAVDNTLWVRRPEGARSTPEKLAEAWERFPGNRGRVRAAELLPLGIGMSDSPPETIIRLRFLRAGLPRAIANLDIRDPAGRFVARPDLQFADYRMAFDYEGDHHRTDAAQWRKDLARVPRLEDLGWHHTRISGRDSSDSRELIERTWRRLRERGWAG